MVEKEVVDRQIKFKKLQTIQSDFKSSCNRYSNAGQKNALFKPNLPIFREYNCSRPHAIKNGSQAYLVQNPDAFNH